MDFPLKTDFFPQVRLTADERRRYVATGEQSARALRSSMKALDWKKTLEKDGVTYAQAHCIEGSSNLPSSPVAGKTDDELLATASACLMMSATAFAAGTITEALEALASPVTDDYRRAMHFLHGPRFVDGVCLHTIAGGTANGSSRRGSNSQAFTTVKWAAFDDGKGFNATGSPAGTDYCFLEHSGIHRDDPNGNDPEHFGFSIQESITRECEVPSLTGVGLARGHLHRTGILILPTDRSDVVQVTSILQMRMSEGNALGGVGDNAASSSSGKAMALALARQMRHRVAAVGRLDLLLERRRLSKLQHVPRADWVADDARKACAVCVKPFALRRRKHHCRHCGEVVCASCAPTREVDEDTTTIHVRICTACVVQSRTGPQTQAGYDVFVFHLRNAGSSSESSTNSTGDCATPTNKTADHEVETRPKSVSSGSSTFSISSDSQMSARLTRAGYAGGAIRLYDFEDASSSGSSSSYSLSDFDSFNNLVAIPVSNQDEADRHYAQRRRSSQRRGSGPAAIALSIGSSSSNTEPSDDLLERIRGMKADLSSLTTSFRQFSDTSSSVGQSNSFVEEDPAVTRTLRSGALVEAPEGIAQDVRRRGARTSDAEDGMDIDFINNGHFTLLCPETLSQQWRTRSSSRVQQDAGEKSYLSASLSNMSFMSTLSNSTMLEDDTDDTEQRDSQGFGAGERSESQAELNALRRQVEGLHRSLAAATSQLDIMSSRRGSRQQIPPSLDPVAARHQVTYGLLVEELHEIMGLPRPGARKCVSR